jgi:histidine triad (HIT) family protein
MSCIFCKIASKEVPARIRYEDAEFVAFEDLHPQAPVHLLLIPKHHVASLGEVTESDAAWLGRLLARVPQLARELGLARGFRLVTNSGPEGGQTVHHLHFHLLGGRSFHWPPG